MDKRFFLAIALSAVVIVATPLLFRAPPRAPSDTTALRSDSGAMAAATTSGATPQSSLPSTSTAAANGSAPAAQPLITRSDTVRRAHANLVFATLGVAPAAVELPGFKDLRKGHGGTVVVSQPALPLLHYRLVRAVGDTIDLGKTPSSATSTPSGIEFTAPTAGLTISYAPDADGYRTRVTGNVAGAGTGAALIVDLPANFLSHEADSLDDERHFNYGYRRGHSDPVSVAFAKLDSAVIRTDVGPMAWVDARDKYFLTALIATDSTAQFSTLRMQGGHKIARGVTLGTASAVLPLKNGQFSFDLYVGPQRMKELHALGNDMEDVNSYAGLLHPIVQPFATIVLNVLIWMKAKLNVNYGWVLVIFGVCIRLALWPLNQTAMKTSIKMQQIQPEDAALQKRYGKDVQALQQARAQLYADHGMSPLSPFLGCLPALLPMPILYALYFVFQNTIEFRGVPFLWLPDLSLADPYYITPLIMGASMFLLSWIGLKAAPNAPQAMVMAISMPVVFTFLFLRFAVGLNIYYAVQNITALPQQLLITRERMRARPASAAASRSLTGKKPG